MSAAAVIAVRRKRLIRKFREAGATDPPSAVPLESLGVRRSWIFNQMVDAGVFLPTSDGRYYLNEGAGVEFLHRQRMRMLIGTGLVLLVFLGLWAFGLLGR